jgi:hypothetical protein
MVFLALALPVLTAICGWHLASYTAWVHPVHLVASGAVAALALAAPLLVWKRWQKPSIAGAVFLLGVQLAIMVLSLAGVKIVGPTLFPSTRVAVVVGIVIAIAIVGLVCGRIWGRWLGIALAMTGVMSGGLNAVNFWSVTSHPQLAWPEWSAQMYEQTWLYMVTVIGSALIAVLLARVQFADTTTWASRHRLLRTTVIAAFIAMPMLLVYAWIQPVVPATRTSAIVLAAALAVAGTLTVRGKLAGALLLVLAGAGLLAQTAVTIAKAHELWLAGYYAAFWAPCGLLAIACGVKLARPTVRLMSQSIRT